MEKSRWNELELLYEKASALPSEQRAAFLETCSADPSLKEELASLLALADEAPQVLHKLAENIVTPALVSLLAKSSNSMDQAQDELIGQRISHYKVLERIGLGGMGVVYKARDTKLNRIVALKLLPPHLSSDDTAKNRLLAEARAASALDHPNIAVVHEIGEINIGQLFIAMAYYEGRTLKEKINDGPLQVDEAFDIVKQIAEGLSAAHIKGIVHRDIKPSNILLANPDAGETGKVSIKIVDFGIAKMLGEELTKTGSTMGTAAYMSPEQTYGKAVDHRTDLWSLGVCFYEMLTGQRPFALANEQAAIYAIRNDQPESVQQLRPEVPTQIIRVVDKCLAKDADKRYQKANDILADLDTIETGRPLSRLKTIGSSWQKRAWLYSSLIAVLIAGAIFFRLPARIADITMESQGEGNVEPTNRLAVLPLLNYSQEPADEYLADGITEELISRLSKFGELRVIARTSVMAYKNTDKRIVDISRELQVATILEGSVRKTDNRIRVAVKLIDSQTEEQIWSQEYDTVLNDVLAVQSEIASRVANEMGVHMKSGEQRRLARKGTENPEAYQLYLRGRYFWDKWEVDRGKKAIKYFEQAIAIDPTYAQAHAGLADAYSLLGEFGVIVPKDAYTMAMDWAEKALALDEQLAEAHAAVARINMRYYWNWQEVDTHFKRAIELNPNSASARDSYGEYLRWMGRFDEAISQGQRARELDPLSFVINWDLAHTYYASHQYEQALAEFQKTAEMYPNLDLAYLGLGFVYVQMERHEEAISAFQTARDLSSDLNDPIALQGYAYAKAGRKNEALNILHDLNERSKQSYVPPFLFALLYIALDEKDKAFDFLQRAYEDRNWFIIALKVDPMFDPVRSDSRFNALLHKVGMAD